MQNLEELMSIEPTPTSITEAQGPALNSQTLSGTQRDVENKLANWKFLIESAAQRILVKHFQILDRALSEEARDSCILRPIGDKTGGEKIFASTTELCQAIKIAPIEQWFANPNFDQKRTEVAKTVAIISTQGESVDSSVTALAVESQFPQIVERIIDLESEIYSNANFGESLRQQRIITGNMDFQLVALQRLDLLIALESIDADLKNLAIASARRVGGLGPLADSSPEQKQEKFDSASDLYNQNGEKLLALNLNLFNVLMTGQGEFVRLKSDDLRPSTEAILKQVGFEELLRELIADPNLWTMYRASQFDHELLSKTAQQAAEQFNDYPSGNNSFIRNEKSILSRGLFRKAFIEQYLSDALDRVPRLSSGFASTEFSSWGYKSEDVQTFLHAGTSPELRSKIVARYLLDLCTRFGDQGDVDTVFSKLKSNPTALRKVLMELTPVLSLVAVQLKIAGEAIQKWQSSPKEYKVVEFGISYDQFNAIERFIELAKQMVPDCINPELVKYYQALQYQEREKAVALSADALQIDIARGEEVAGLIPQFAELQNQLKALIKTRQELEGEMQTAQEDVRLIQERYEENKLADFLWRKFKYASELSDAELVQSQRAVAVSLTEQPIADVQKVLDQVSSSARQLLAIDLESTADGVKTEMQREKVARLEALKAIEII